MSAKFLALPAKIARPGVCLLLLLAIAGLWCSPDKASALPAVSEVTPVAGATEVPLTSTIRATFSEPMDTGTITSGSFTLSQPVRISAIAAGYNYTLVLRENGTVSGWGNNAHGETTVPGGLNGVIALSAGSNHAVALQNDGTVIAWGANTLGQSTVPGGLATVTALATGTNFTLALKADGTVLGWGDNSSGQTAVPGGLAGVSRIAAGSNHALALKSDGTVVAWGNNSFGQISVPSGLAGVIAVAAGFNHSLALKADGTLIAWGANNKGQITLPAGLSEVVAISAGSDYSVALKADGTVVVWGDNTYRQADVPAGLSGVTAIAAGCYHMAALKSDGTLLSWGDNSCSQTSLPVGLTGVAAAAAGNSHTVALKSDGTLFAWGDNSSGQASIPAGISPVAAVSAGFAHTLSLSSAGAVTAWGKDDYGQATVPADLGTVIAVAAGDNHSAALKNYGTLVAWGLNTSGQTTVPAGLSGVTEIAAGTAHTLALKQDGSVTAWGSNAYNAVSIPVGLSGVTALAAAGYHSVALKNDGSLTAWGDNTSGQSTVPQDLSSVIAIAAGPSHTVALRSDGTVAAWGANDLGQIAVPAGMTDVIAIAAGNDYTVAVKKDGTLVSWGANKVGQATVPHVPYRQEIAASIDYSTGSNSATLTPAALLPRTTTLTATVNSGVRSLAGTHPAADQSWSFTTVTAPLTTAVPAGGSYSSPQNITLTASEPATIYYTTNGSAPTTASPVYTGPIRLLIDTILKFFARDGSGNNEPVQTESYTIGPDTTHPVTTAVPAGGTYSTLQNVTLTASEPATIYYTTNGSEPTTASLVYIGSIRLLVNTILKFFARDSSANSEPVQTANYTINLDTTPPLTTAIPPGGSYSLMQSVVLTANEPATIYYTTNGSEPTTTSPVYSGPVQLLVNSILKFFAKDTAGNSGGVTTEAYTIKQAQTISFTALPAKTYGAPAFILNATASSGLPVSYTSSNPAVATVSSTTVTIVGAGTATITASQGGNADYNEAAAVLRTLTVNKAPLTVQVTNASREYGLANPAFGATYSGFVNADTVAVLSGSPGLSTLATPTSPVGSYPITAAAGTLTAANYSFSFINGTLTVTKADQTITFGVLPSKTYGDLTVTISGSASSGLPVGYTSSNPSVATVSGTTLTIVGAGSAAITANQDGNGYYNPASAVIQALTVSKAVLTVQAANVTREYGLANPALSAAYSGFVNGDSETVLSGAAELTTVATTASPVGSYPVIAATGTLAAANYSFSFASGTLTISKANQTITFGSLTTKTYGDPSFMLSASSNSGLPVNYSSSNSAVATVSGSTVTIIGSGVATITASQDGDAAYNPAVAIVQTLTVTKASLTIQAVDATRPYGAVNPAFSATYSGFVNGDTETVLSGSAGLSTIATTTTSVGSYPITAAAGTLVAANYSFSFVNGSLAISKAGQTITFSPLPAKTYGDLSFSLSATSSSGLPISYTSSNSSVATVSGSTLTIVAAGTAVITANQEGDDNYLAALSVAQPLTINKATATVTLGSLSTTYDGTPKSATATTVPAGLTVGFTYNGAATAPTAVASYSVVGTVSDSNYQGSASGTLTIAKGNQTITFGALPAKTYGDTAFALTATASSNLAVTYTSSNSAVATVSGSMVTIVGAGTATITASQTGNANYNAAPAVAQTLTINKAVATILFGQLAFTYDGNPKPVSATTVPAGLTVTFTYDGSATAPIDVGNYTVVATVNNANYQGTATATEEIAKKSQTITFGPLPVKTYGDAPFLFSADASSNLNLTFDYNTAIATITKQGQKYLITIVGAGTTTVTATQAGNRNYSDAPPVSQTLIINKAAGTVTLGNLSATYDGSAKATTATTNPAGMNVTFTYNGSATAPTAAGSYSVIGTISNTNYQGSASGTLAIAKANQSISFGPLPAKSYGNAPFNLAASTSSGLPVNFTSSNPAVATTSGSIVTIVGIGTTTITASQGGDGNYNPAVAVPQILTVSKGTATVTLGSLSTSYNGSPRTVTATTVPNGLSVTLTYNGSATAPVAVGTYTVAATVTDANYDGNTTGTLIIDKGIQTITFDPLPAKTYGEAAFNLTAVSSSALTVSYTSSNPAVATISGTTVTITGAGTTTINALQGGDDNYNAAAAAPQMLTVSKGTATITLGSLTTSYNGTAQAATAITVPGSLPVTFTYNGSAALPVAVGTYTVSATVTDLHYEGTNTGTLIVAKGVQTITFGALDPKAYGDGAFTLTAAANSGLAVSYSSSNPAVATISGTTVTIVGAGTTTITASQGGDGNYNPATAEPRALTVSKGTATILLGSLSTTYNGTPRAVTATTTPNGLPVTLAYNGSATAPTAAGTYTVAATVTSPNYQGSSSGSLTIAKAAQTITFGTLPVKTVGNAPFTLTATATSGLAISYTSSNPAVATISGTTVTIIGAGSATITAIQGGDENYNAASFVPQTMTVNVAQASSGKTTVTIGAITSYFDTLAATFAAITPGSTAQVKLQTLTFAEAVNLNISGATVSIGGGFDSAFSSATGMTTIQGSLVISAGTLVVDRLAIM